MHFRFLSFRSRAVPDLLQKSMPTFYNLYLAKQNIQRYNLLRQRKQDKHCKMLQLIWMMLLCRCQRFVLLSSLSVMSYVKSTLKSNTFSLKLGWLQGHVKDG